ncbi:MAG: U32 family peptidase [Bacteroidales bacterium]|jgi:collagenase-like PrtC family protease|nr:U32 family peptidase [Bacteroidales bacterium]HHT51821.1 U32 family peptidase [Bacteroidales bacterium]
MSKVELLAPAKNGIYGQEAINHGADAVYIGAPQFSARVAANSSIAEIEELVRYAHRYEAKVFVALNTILDDRELGQSAQLINQFYNIGVDALIIQDVGILSLDLPPIPLHASTQMDNRSLQRILLLEQWGFERAILARELTLEEIAQIRQNSSIELEAFVHGALCVSYSGRCYLSRAYTGRSANRGNCSQLCRLPYTLVDQSGKVIVQDRHLLSLKDMDRSHALKEMMDAGITSFKIEGRLKELSYLKNITSYYRQKLDAILNETPDYQRASFGTTTFFFTPDPTKTFHRDKTEYFLKGRIPVHTTLNTPKSTGELIGKVTRVFDYYFTYEGKPLNNGDGMITFDSQEQLVGFKVNRVEGSKVFPATMPILEKGQILYRNEDHDFEKQLSGKTAERKLALSIQGKETTNGLMLSFKDEMGNQFVKEYHIEKEIARNQEMARENTIKQLSRIGNTYFYIQDINIEWDTPFFIPSSQISTMKREMLEGLEEMRTQRELIPNPRPRKKKDYGVKVPKELSYLFNVANSGARKIYFSEGAEKIDPAFEQQIPEGNPLVMQCKHCIKYALGFCPKYFPDKKGTSFQEPFYLKQGAINLRVEFDCKECVMNLYSLPKGDVLPKGE